MITARLRVGGREYKYCDIQGYSESEGISINKLPFSLKILLENLIRHQASDVVSAEDVRALASWKPGKIPPRDIAYHPARIVMQDFTGVPALVDLAAMRDALANSGEDVLKINPQIPVDLVIDHSISADYCGSSEAFKLNVELEFERNLERYRFLKWGQGAFKNFRVVPPGTGIIHQVNLEYLAKVVWLQDEGGEVFAYPDTVVGTDSHTTMVNSMGVLGWGVGGIEAEAAMLGQPVTMLIPEVVGLRLDGRLPPGCTATDLVLRIVKLLRSEGVVGKFVEFFGEGLDSLSLADRAAISNMAPEYGATCGFFPIDGELISYLNLTGREPDHAALVEAYAKAQGLWRNDAAPADYSRVLTLNMGQVLPAVAGPSRPQDLSPLKEAPENFRRALGKTYEIQDAQLTAASPIQGMNHELKHGDVAIAAITSCTNTSNPSVLIAAGLVAKKAFERGVKSKPWVKTSFAPGSRVVTSYLKRSGLAAYLDSQGFQLIGYGCTTCIGNSGPIAPAIKEAINSSELVTVNVLSGNRNFEGRVHPDSKASYLASPPLVVAYALAGTILIDFENEPIAEGKSGEPVYLRDIWPSPGEIRAILNAHLIPELFRKTYSDILTGPEQWKALKAPSGARYEWEEDSTYIRRAPFFDGLAKSGMSDVLGARCLAIFPNSTTTDHISPAGSIPRDGPAGRYLAKRGIAFKDFNSFGSRRGNHEVMIRGAFANIRIKNAMADKREGGYTRGFDGQIVTIFDAAESWKKKGAPLIVLSGKEYGVGSSRDWAAKGPMLLGVRAVIAQSYERIHRSNLIGMGILPLEFQGGASAGSLGLNGTEEFSITGLGDIEPGQKLMAAAKTAAGKRIEIPVICRIDTSMEMNYWKSGGILAYVLKNLQKYEG